MHKKIHAKAKDKEQSKPKQCAILGPNLSVWPEQVPFFISEG